MPSSDGTDSNATIDGAPVERPPLGAPIATSPLRGSTTTEQAAQPARRSRAHPEPPEPAAAPERTLQLLDGDGDDAAPVRPRSITPATATTIGDFAAAMTGPLAAALLVGSPAVFIGAALFVLLIRAQGRRSALNEREVAVISPVAAGLGSALLCLAVEPGGAVGSAVGAGLVALATGTAAALLLRALSDRLVHTRIALLGDAADAHDLAWQLAALPDRRQTLVGWVTRSDERESLRELDHVSFRVRRLGVLADLSQVVARNDIDLLLMGDVDDRLRVFDRATVCSERYRTRLLDLTAFEEQTFRRVPLDQINTAWFQHIMHPRFRPVPQAVTRTLDVLCAVALGLLTLPLWAPTALFMRLAFGRPVLVRRHRVGERGAAVHLLHFRVARREVTGAPPGEDRPAVGFGRFLRMTGIERLPLLWNLLRGDITLVGPRPLHPDDLAELELEFIHYGRRNMLRPGITGWAQIHRAQTPREQLSHDLFYLKHQSLMLWIHVLLATPLRFLSHRSRRTTSN